MAKVVTTTGLEEPFDPESAAPEDIKDENENKVPDELEDDCCFSVRPQVDIEFAGVIPSCK